MPVEGEGDDEDQPDLFDNFILELNDGEAAMVEPKKITKPEMKEETKETIPLKGNSEIPPPFPMDGFVPPGLSPEIFAQLQKAREMLKEKKKAKTNLALDRRFETMMEGDYNDDNVGGCEEIMEVDRDNTMENLIDRSEFDSILQDFINDNKNLCGELYQNYSTIVEKDQTQLERIREKESKGIIATAKELNDEALNKVTKPTDLVYVSKEFVQNAKKELEEAKDSQDYLKIRAVIRKYMEKFDQEDDSAELYPIMEEPKNAAEKWDCESIISTYTNTDNHPALIQSIVKPKNKINFKDLTKVAKEDRVIEEEEVDSEGEESEEQEISIDLRGLSEKEKKKAIRKIHKKAMKEEKRAKRISKKEQKNELKDEYKKQTRKNVVQVGHLKPGTSVRRIQ